MNRLRITSRAREQLIDITEDVNGVLREQGWKDGLLLLFCPHTTAALTVNEAADPDVARDITAFLRRAIPRNADFAHAEGNSDAHLKSSLVGPDLTLIVEDGTPLLGRWQGLYFLEGDGPRDREIWLKFLPSR